MDTPRLKLKLFTELTTSNNKSSGSSHRLEIHHHYSVIALPA
jgi:hypothetical protein